MKKALAVLTIFGASATLALANHGGGGGGGHMASSGHGHPVPAADSAAAGPQFGGAHFAGHPYMNGRFYYPGTVSHSGNGRVINYPGVRSSTIHSGTHHATSGGNAATGNHTGSHQHSGVHRQAATVSGDQSRGSDSGGGETSNLSKNSHHTGNVSMHGRTGRSKQIDPQTAQKLRNWNGHKDSLAQAKANHDDNCHHHHDHDWWHNHCPVIIWSDWGWWGWNDGWWYPAWGYDDYYASYAYDGPIYDYNGLPPDQVVSHVQSELHRRGYYSHSIDGSLGPQTQAALARYQADHQIPVTATIDPATLGSLGLAR